MDSTSLLIDFLLKKYNSEKKGTLQVIDQLSEEDIVWAPTPESNSITNLVAHNLPPLKIAELITKLLSSKCFCINLDIYPATQDISYTSPK